MKYFILTAFVLVATLLISQVIVANSSSDSETIQYKVIEKKEGYEIRKYPKLTVATTKFNSNSYRENSRAGFRKIASYIFGGNSSNKQIAMTSPVQMDISENASMSFFMPPEMALSDLPLPNRKDVTIRTEQAKIVAAIQFSGWASNDVLEEKYQELIAKLKAHNIAFEKGYSYLGYNPPYQIVNRKNEIIVKLINYEAKTSESFINSTIFFLPHAQEIEHIKTAI